MKRLENKKTYRKLGLIGFKCKVVNLIDIKGLVWSISYHWSLSTTSEKIKILEVFWYFQEYKKRPVALNMLAKVVFYFST